MLKKKLNLREVEHAVIEVMSAKVFLKNKKKIKKFELVACKQINIS